MEYSTAACFVSMIDISALVMMVVEETAPVGFSYLNVGCVCKLFPLDGCKTDSALRSSP
jgi:hypothetical protein